MDKKKAHMLIAGMIAMALALSICIYFGVFKEGDVDEGTNAVISDKAEVYTKAYTDYAQNNPDTFGEGMLLCDINGDDIPELFSMEKSGSAMIMKYHKFADGVVFPYEDLGEIVFDCALITEPATFCESPRSFIGLYRNRNTGERNLIVSCITDNDSGYREDNFCIVSFDGGTMTVSDKSANISEDGIRSADSRRDEVMVDYELIEGGLHFAHSHNSIIDDPRETLYSLISKFGSESPLAYGELADGDYYCYVKDIDLATCKAVIVPTQQITLKEYSTAINGNRIVKINDESMSIQINEKEYDETGRAYLYAENGRVYSFVTPTEESPESVVEGYMRRRHVMVNISDNTIVRYGVLGYDADGNPTGYETLGREEVYSIRGYMSNYARYSMGGYCKVVIRGGEIQYLDVLYRP
ncbi:MAG: hypothetical protein IKB50_01215 [Clostridia bacterium]|nr:hypothetical protein [Clostridia bacterium]